jgi:hypothetical protein
MAVRSLAIEAGRVKKPLASEVEVATTWEEGQG